MSDSQITNGQRAATLASQVPSPHGHRFTAAQARLAEAGEHLLSALERSAARPEPSGRLTLAQRVRDRYPLKHHPHRRPDTGDHPARLAMASFPASPAGLAGQPPVESAASPAPRPRAEAPAHALTGEHAMTGSASVGQAAHVPQRSISRPAPASPIPGPRPPRKGDGPSFPSLGGSYGRSRRP